VHHHVQVLASTLQVPGILQLLHSGALQLPSTPMEIVEKKWQRPHGHTASALPRLKNLKAPRHSGYLPKSSPVNGASLAAASHHQGPKKPLEFAATDTIISAEMPRM
jgi:hypothetical protein